MECPKCGLKIDEDTLVCPNCKKVLKLVCPICHTVNKSNTCHKCGYIIINKCHQCGKINPTIQGKCSKCGFDTHLSAILQDSNIEDFATVTIDFPNIEDMQAVFGSKHLYEKFREKLNGLIYDYSRSIGLKRGVFGNTYVIRFNKDYTYAASAKNAVKSSIELLNLITQLNLKLTKAKDAQLKCNIAIIKRNVYASGEDYKSGININLIYKNLKRNNKFLNNLQLIVDGSIYEIVNDSYPMDSIGMTRVKQKSLLLYELNLKDYIHLEMDEGKEEELDIKIPDIIEAEKEILENEDSIYDIDGISFNEIHCEFAKEITQGLSSQIAQRFMAKNRSIIVIKGKKEYYPRTLEVIDKIKQNNIFNSIHKVTCYDDIKFKPYGLFNDLISGMYGFSTTGKTKDANNFHNLKFADPQGFLENMVNLKEREVPHPEEVRNGIFKAFENIINKLQKSLIIIENIEKIDDSSFDLLQQMLKNFEQYNLSWLIIADKDFNLHKSAHFLLAKREYTEITLKPTPIKALIEANAQLCKNVLNSFYMQKISKNTKGSQMYFMQALIHLLDLGIFKVEKGSLEIAKSETVVFPTTLDELIQRRLIFIKSIDENLFKLFACILLIGPQLDLQSIKFFNNPNVDEYLKYLDSKGYIYISNGVIQVQNYNLYSENIFTLMTTEEIRATANFLIVYFFKENAAHPLLAKLYSLVESEKNEFVQWENLSNINRSLGDFSAYLNCSLKFIKLLQKNINESAVKSVDEYKIEVYENIANLLYKYTPEKIASITEIILENIESISNDKKVVSLGNKIMQGCLISGNYNHALLMTHKVLSRFENAGTNPKMSDFNVQALTVQLIKIEILFNVGDLEDCINEGEEVFNNLLNVQLEDIKPKTYSNKQFNDLITDAAGYILFAKILQLKNDTYKFCETIEQIIKNIPDDFKLFVELDNLIHGRPVTFDKNNVPNNSNKFAAAIFYILSAFTQFKDNANNFAIEIYHAKLKAKSNHLIQLELFCDLMIGRAYMKLNKDKKATTIFNSVMETAQNNGLKNISYLAAYTTSEIALKNNDNDAAYGIIANTIIKLEKSNNYNPYILMLFKKLYARVLILKKEDTQADFCYNQAIQIAETFNLKIQ